METTLHKILCAMLFLFVIAPVFGQTTYSWEGGSTGSWTASSSWDPARTNPQPDDILLFDDGLNATVTNVPSQTVGSLLILTNSSIAFQTSTANSTLTVTGSFQVGNNCNANIATNGTVLNVSIAGGGTAEISGTVTMYMGTFALLGNSTLILNNRFPIQKTNGQFSLSSGTTVQFGTGGETTSPQIELPDNIFIASPTVSNVIVNNENGARFGNQSITINNGLDLTLGTLVSNATGRIILNASASLPTETADSKIEGYVELTRSVGTAGLSFMGLEIQPGADDIGSVTVTRRTGSSGINSFNGAQSIAATWNINAQVQPTSGRTLSLSWVSNYDNGNDPNLRFQVYRYDGGPDWEPVGSLAFLSVTTADSRTTASVTTLHFSEWTVADQNQPLPVTWRNFYGETEHSGIALKWETSTEENSDFFIVEKLVDENEFAALGNVKAHGNTRAVQRYDFFDSEPAFGSNYYRLKQVDLDGKFTYSKMIHVLFDPQVHGLYTAYPNPVTARLSVRRNFVFDGDARVMLVDQFGREIFSGEWKEEETIALPDLNIPAGLYRLIVTDRKGRYNQLIVVR